MADPAAFKLVVGLGNPGRRYAATRHNVGFEVAGQLARRYATGRVRSKFRGEVVEFSVDGHRGILLCPQTYMNRSGESVLAARDFYKLDEADLLIVCDDFNLPLGKLRFRAKGSSGGQKGLQDIFRCLGTERIARLRIGIGTPPPRWSVTDFVLSKFTSEELPVIRGAVERGAEGVAEWMRSGINECMNQYNADATPGQ
jgi:PTH1 family peptidyl-tRNA hydrolase